MIWRSLTSTAAVSGSYESFVSLAIISVARVKRSHKLLVDLGGIRIFLPLLRLPFLFFFLEARLFHGRFGNVARGGHGALCYARLKSHSCVVWWVDDEGLRGGLMMAG